MADKCKCCHGIKSDNRSEIDKTEEHCNYGYEDGRSYWDKIPSVHMRQVSREWQSIVSGKGPSESGCRSQGPESREYECKY